MEFANMVDEERAALALSSKDTAKKLLTIFDKVVTVNEEAAEEFLTISDPKMKNSLLALFDAVSKFENQCLSHVKRLHRIKD